MGQFSAYLVIAVGALAACGNSNNTPVDAAKIIDAPPAIDAKVFLDAPPPTFDLTCIPNPAPTTALATITVSGTVTEIGLNGTTPTFTMLSGATVLGCKLNCMGANQLATAASATDGTFTDSNIATGSLPLAGYLKMTHTGDRTVQAYPATPITANIAGVPVLTFTPTVIAALSLLGFTQSAANGMIGVSVTDCADMPINDGPNLVLSVKQGTTELVTSSNTLDVGTLNPTYAGFYVVFNVPPGATTVGASYKGMNLLAHVVDSIAATTTETLVRPGYH